MSAPGPQMKYLPWVLVYHLLLLAMFVAFVVGVYFRLRHDMDHPCDPSSWQMWTSIDPCSRGGLS